MDYNIKFPIEHFDEIWSNVKLRSAVSELAKRNTNPVQPVLLSDDEWRLALAGVIENESTEVYKTISMLAAWGFTKAIYTCPREFITALVVSDFDEIEYDIERLLRFSSCAYFEGEWAWFDLQVQGWWMTVAKNGDGTGCLRVILNTPDGLVPYDVLLDERGLDECLVDSVPGIREWFGGSRTASIEEIDEIRVIYSGLVNAVRVALYLLSDNAEIEAVRTHKTQQHEAGGFSLPGEITFFEIGKNAGERVKQAEAEGVVKPAHWHVESDGSVKWLCGYESHYDNLLVEFEKAEPLTDEELVQANKGLHENDFSVPLMDEHDIYVVMTEEEFIKARDWGIEKVHEARARVYAAQGRCYDRTVQEGEPWARQKSVTAPVTPPSDIDGQKVH